LFIAFPYVYITGFFNEKSEARRFALLISIDSIYFLNIF